MEHRPELDFSYLPSAKTSGGHLSFNLHRRSASEDGRGFQLQLKLIIQFKTSISMGRKVKHRDSPKEPNDEVRRSL